MVVPPKHFKVNPCISLALVEQMNNSSYKLQNFTLKASNYYQSATQLPPPLTPKDLLNSLHLSLTHSSLTLTHQCHAQILSHGFTKNPFLATKLVTVYAVHGLPLKSRAFFDSVQHKSLCLWNSLINGYVRNSLYGDAFGLFARMGTLPDGYTLASVLKACGESGDLVAGRLVHGESLKLGLVLEVVVANSVMGMYSRCGEYMECMKVFGEMPERSVASWNVVIAGCAGSKNGVLDMKMLGFVRDMRHEGLNPDAFTVSSLLPYCNDDRGRELHGFIIRSQLGFSIRSDAHLDCSLIDMYGRSGKIDIARRVFDRMKSRNLYVWTAIVNSYMLNGAIEEGLALFREMQLSNGIQPNTVSLVSVLPACTSISGVLLGKQIHGYAIRRDYCCDVSLCNALIVMYSKCGNLSSARRIFDDSLYCRDEISWSSMVSGYGLHGKGEEAVAVYDMMLQLGNKPDMITLVGILSGCARSGLVNEALCIYESAIDKYGLKPTHEVCACMIDMLGRSGQLGQALEFIKQMPINPGASAWGALVSAAAIHGNVEMQDLAYRFLIQLEPENPSNYVSLSNLHAASSRWEVVAEVRKTMKDKGMKKIPGWSWISINNTIHSFYAADKLHPCSGFMYEMLNRLALLMKEATHSPYDDSATIMYGN